MHRLLSSTKSAPGPADVLRASLLAALLLALSVSAVQAQSEYPLESDVASPEAIVTAMYESISRAAGDPFDWGRFHSLFIAEATLIPNTERAIEIGRLWTPETYSEWVENYSAENAPIGSPDDRGFREEGLHNVVLRYGNVAQVFSAYQMRYWDDDEIRGRGINSFQLIYRDGRWWIVSITWDEESGAGPIPEQYLE